MKTSGSFKKGHITPNQVRGDKHPMYKHGLYGTPLYKKWMAMKRRCLNPKDISYKNYGGRGIAICEKWLSFEGFNEDMSSSFTPGMSLERIDNNGNYEKNNCKWIPLDEQAKNKRSVVLYEHGGKRMSVGEWEKVLGVKRGTIRARVRNGWPISEAIRTPIHSGNKYRRITSNPPN